MFIYADKTEITTKRMKNDRNAIPNENELI